MDLSQGPIAEHYASLPGFSSINTFVEQHRFVDLIAVVSSFSEIKPTKGSDMQRSLVVCDPTASMPSSGLMVQFYRPVAAELPRPVSGSIIILRKFKLFDYRGSFQAWSHNSSSWIVYDANGKNILNSTLRMSSTSPDIQNYVFRLAGWWKARSGISATSEVKLPENANSAMAHSTERSTLTVKEVRENKFFNIYGYIVKTFPSRDNAFTIYLTDYTTNALLHDYQHGEGRWQGPFGQQTIQITLWDINARFGHAHLHDDMYVYLRNVHGKRNNAGRLEGALRGDRMHPGRVNVTPIASSDPLVKNIKLRRHQSEATWKVERAKQEEELMMQAQSEKVLQLTPPTSINPNLATSYAQVPTTPIGDILEPPYLPAMERTEGPGARKRPRKYRTVGRIIDFWPVDLRDFARPYCMSCQSTYAPTHPDLKAQKQDSQDSTFTTTTAAATTFPEICTICGAERDTDDPDTYEFAFTVLVEGQDSVAMPLIFSGSDIETLFADPDLVPCNLYLTRNKPMLSRLRERLFLLWGDLEERYAGTKDARKKRKNNNGTHSGRSGKQTIETPLMWNELCVMEYWVNEVGGTAGWKGRRFKAFGSRIL